MKIIAVHCSATPPDRDIGAAEIDKMHKAKGWSSIGYNYVIRRDGSLERGRAEGSTLAHASGHNNDAIAVCLIGGVTDDGAPEANYTRAQWTALETALKWFALKYPQAEILGHRDLSGTSKDCPCFNVRHWLATRQVIEPRKPAGRT